MNLAARWGILSAFGAGVCAGGGYILWKDRQDRPPIEGTVIINGRAEKFGDPMDCVGYYYKAVMECNHEQYQVCVYEPLSRVDFEKKANNRLEEMRKHGIRRTEMPVKGRSAKIRERKGFESVEVKAISPWTNKEETYLVIKQGQSWKIHKEDK